MKPAHTTITIPGITPIDALENTVLSIRGTVIHYFVRIEMMIDTIIIKTLFDNEETYLKYMEILVPNGNINMKIKLKLLGVCLEKYKNKNGGDFSKFMEQLKAIIEIRDNLAHKLLDTSVDAVELFEKENKFRFFIYKNGKISSYINYDKNMIDKTIHSIRVLQREIIVVYTNLNNNLSIAINPLSPL